MENLENPFQKYGEDNENFFKAIFEDLTKEFEEEINKAKKDKEISYDFKLDFNLESEHVIYNRNDGAKAKYLRWEKIPKKDDVAVNIEDRLRQDIVEDLQSSKDKIKRDIEEIE